MDNETLQLLRDVRDQLRVCLAWPANEKLRSRIRVAVARAEGPASKHETDVHVWAKPETATIAALFTISEGASLICKDLPKGAAAQFLSNFLQELADR